MRALDDFLIDRIFQPVVNWCGSMFGWTQWVIAKQANYASLACVIIYHGMRMMNGGSPVMVAIFLGFGMLWFIIMKNILSQFASTEDGATRIRAVYLFLRLVTVSFAIVHLSVRAALDGIQSLNLIDLRALVVVICLYAMACGDPPPKEVRQSRMAMAGAG